MLTRRVSPGEKTHRPKGVTNASAPQAADDIGLFSADADGTRLSKIIDASASATVLPLNGGSCTAIKSLQLNQWGGVHGQTAPSLAESGSLSAKSLGRICPGGSWSFVGDVRGFACRSQRDNGRVGSNGLGWRGRRREVLDGGEARRKERGVGHWQGGEKSVYAKGEVVVIGC
jgi:hypothetical protein